MEKGGAITILLIRLLVSGTLRKAFEKRRQESPQKETYKMDTENGKRIECIKNLVPALS